MTEPTCNHIFALLQSMHGSHFKILFSVTENILGGNAKTTVHHQHVEVMGKQLHMWNTSVD